MVLIVDISPLPWIERDIKRSAQDKRCEAKGKRSVGPGNMSEMLAAVQAFVAAYTSMERQAALIIIGVADQETAVLYPRKDALQAWLDHPESFSPAVIDIPSNLLSGVSELTARAAQKASTKLQAQEQSPSHSTEPADQSSRQGAMASAVSRALCLINRIMVATQASGGISALHATHYLQRSEDDSIVAMMGSSNKGGNSAKKTSSSAGSVWSPRIFCVQASEDRGRDYNAMMNNAFCASQQNIVIDGCFVTAGADPNHSPSSAFLEQVCDLTGGLYLAPPCPAQVGSMLTEVLLSVFLPRVDCRPAMQLPGIDSVDFRARCFETAEMIDLGHVCNQCLSIFAQNPIKNGTHCPTCQARIISPGQKKST